jgi:hypothetical protein
VVDSHGVLWVLCSARMGNEGYLKQHVTEAIFLIDDQGRQISTAELDLPLTQEERLETSDYRLTSLSNGEMGLTFNKIRTEGPGAFNLGAYYTRLGTDGTVAPLHLIAGPGPRYNEFLSLTNGDLFLGGSEGLLSGSEGALLAFDPSGALRWKKSLPLDNPSSANLSDGNICVSAWTVAKQGVLNKLRLMRLDQRGTVQHILDIKAHPGQVAAGPDGSCAVLYDQAPSFYTRDYYLTVFDRSFTRQWTVHVPETLPDFSLVSLAEGYLAQIDNVLVEYNWSGKKKWSTNLGPVHAIVTPSKDGFYIVAKNLNLTSSFHVKRAVTTGE